MADATDNVFTKDSEATLNPIAYSQTTTETINENFRDLMKEIQSQIQTEYDEGRITGTDYANVYLGSIQTALQLAAQVETFEAKRSSHVRQWKLKALDSITSQHAMISNVLGTLDEANILPIVRDTYNDLYAEVPPAWVAGTYGAGDRVTHGGYNWVTTMLDGSTTTVEPGTENATNPTWRKENFWL